MRPNEGGDGCAGRRRSHLAGDTVPDLVDTDDDTGDTVPNVMVEQPPEQTTTWDMTLDDGPAPVPWSTEPLRDSRYRGDHPSWPALHKVTVVPPPPWRTFVEIYIDFGASVRCVLWATQIPDDCQAWGSTFEDPWGGRWLEPDEVLAADVDCVQCWHC